MVGLLDCERSLRICLFISKQITSVADTQPTTQIDTARLQKLWTFADEVGLIDITGVCCSSGQESCTCADRVVTVRHDEARANQRPRFERASVHIPRLLGQRRRPYVAGHVDRRRGHDDDQYHAGQLLGQRPGTSQRNGVLKNRSRQYTSSADDSCQRLKS